MNQTSHMKVIYNQNHKKKMAGVETALNPVVKYSEVSSNIRGLNRRGCYT